MLIPRFVVVRDRVFYKHYHARTFYYNSPMRYEHVLQIFFRTDSQKKAGELLNSDHEQVRLFKPCRLT